MSATKRLIKAIEPLGFPFKTLDPFLFCVYHLDRYPAGNDKMEAPRRGDGMDFDSNQPYRMYHGEKIPGFPQHPHRGFETVTATIEGLIDHTDSTGNGGRYGQGDLQWMTAGRGVVHGEMFPLINQDKPNHTRFFQIWLNLPARNKMVPADFAMHWAESIPKLSYPEKKTDITLWAGSLDGKTGLPPPKNSWAADPASDIMILHIVLQPGARYTVPAAANAQSNRMLYFIEGKAVTIGEEPISQHCAITVDATQPAELSVPESATVPTELLLLQGKPIGEPVAKHGPFVMNTREEIMQAFADYQRTRFGGWPWPDDAMVFPRDKGRFALLSGKEERPPVSN